MLARHGALAVFPPAAQFPQVRQDHLAQHGLDGEVGQQPVQGRLCTRLVEPVQAAARAPASSGSPCPRSARAPRAGPDSAEPSRTGVRLVQRGPGRLGRGHAIGQVLLHAPDPALVGLGVQPVTGGGADRPQQGIPALPGAQHMIRHTDAPAELADAQHGVGIVVVGGGPGRHRPTVSRLHKPWTDP